MVWWGARGVLRCAAVWCVGAGGVKGGALRGNDSLLREMALIMAHDAGTTYLPKAQGVMEAQMTRWARTQPQGGFGKLLECGARALDIRTKLDHEGRVIMHHGFVPLPTLLEEALAEAQAWSRDHPQEFMLLYFSHFAAPEAKTRERTFAVLKAAGIQLEENCDKIYSLTEADLAKTGQILAISECVDEDYVPDVVCETLHYSCVNPKRSVGAFLSFDNYMEKATHNSSQSPGLKMAQGHWQINAKTIFLASFRNGSTLGDNHKSKLNYRLAQAIQNKDYNFVNLLEVDNVCEGTSEILSALALQSKTRPNRLGIAEEK
eukprot:CAMPEP_0184523948 /NCGR_PEP_ID=MMETSP0198_2-20121128/9203_1 /TAXON_ID=1112570 /ORGANISM="Thraustochytrium sp., Strain LLF1b" /LENGTH=318 /DNA_ID=CAMNT_0026915107 /DNA_START=34 /DNA_END=990 /DNA_ORIENTATION=+